MSTTTKQVTGTLAATLGADPNADYSFTLASGKAITATPQRTILQEVAADDADVQHWQLAKQGDGTFKITSMGLPGLALGLKADGGNWRAVLDVWNGDATQRWQIVSNPGDRFSLVSVGAAGRALDTLGDMTYIYTWPVDPYSGNQQLLVTEYAKQEAPVAQPWSERPTVTKLSIAIETPETAGASTNGDIFLVVSYRSRYGGIARTDKVNIHARGSYSLNLIDKTLEATDGAGLDSDIVSIYSLGLERTSAWSPAKVVKALIEYANGEKKTLVFDYAIGQWTNNKTEIYNDNAPSQNIQALLMKGNQQAMPFKPTLGKMLTIRAELGQRWKLGGTEYNPNGPLELGDNPYFTNSFSTTAVQGALVGLNYYGGGWQHFFHVGGYYKSRVLAAIWTYYLQSWQSSIPDNQPIGVEVIEEDFDYSFSPADLPPNARKVSVAAKFSQRTDTSIDLKPGMMLHIRADAADTWRISGTNDAYTVNADGSVGNRGGLSSATLSRAPYQFAMGCLVGTLDGGNSYFSVGTYLDMTVLQTGRLQLLCWDTGDSDNTGAIDAYIWTTPVEDQPVGGQDRVYITRVQASGDSTQEFVELKNGSGDRANLKGMLLYARQSSKECFLPEYILEPGQTVKVYGNKADGLSFGSITPVFNDSNPGQVILLLPHQVYQAG